MCLLGNQLKQERLLGQWKPWKPTNSHMTFRLIYNPCTTYNSHTTQFVCDLSGSIEVKSDGAVGHPHTSFPLLIIVINSYNI